MIKNGDTPSVTLIVFKLTCTKIRRETIAEKKSYRGLLSSLFSI